jgi:hypothetical protein
MKNQKIFFASDFHLGAPNKKSSLVRDLAISLIFGLNTQK